MIKSVSSWICDERELETHITVIFKEVKIQDFLSFSSQFMTKESEFIAFIIKTRDKTFQVRFFKKISQRITVFVSINTQSKTFQIWIFKRISQRIIAFVIKTRYKTFQIIFFRRISRRIIALVIKTRYKTFQSRFFKQISQRFVRERRTILLSHWSTEISSHTRRVRHRSSLLSLWSEEIWILSLWWRKISFLRRTWLLSFWSKEISFNVSKFKILCVTREAKTFDNI
jgi:hypothetical protein